MPDQRSADVRSIEEFEERTEAFLDCVRQLVPALRDHAREAEDLRATPEAVVEKAADLGIFSAMVPRRWGGLGLGVRALAEAARILCSGDVSLDAHFPDRTRLDDCQDAVVVPGENLRCS